MKFFDQAGKRINIDHHISNENGCGDVNYVIPTASSASELVYDVIRKEELDAEKEQQQAERERIRQERRANSLATKKERLDAKFDGSVQSLKDFLGNYYSTEDRRDALSLIDEPLRHAVAQFSYPITPEQADGLLCLCGRAIGADAIPRKTLYSLIEIVIKEERAHAANC